MSRQTQGAGGWSSFFLTRRRAPGPEPTPVHAKQEEAQASAKLDAPRTPSVASSSKTTLEDGPGSSDELTSSPEPRHDQLVDSPSRKQRDTSRRSSRQRKSIPFERDSSTSTTRRMPSTSSIDSIVENDIDQEQKEDEDEVSREMGEAFRTLTRVKAKHSAARPYDTVRNAGNAPMEATSVAPGTTVMAPGGWWEWGTTRLRSTLSRGVASSLFDGQEQGEGWMEKQRQKARSVDEYVDRIVGFAGVDGEERAVVTLTAPALPPSSVTSHDVLLERILSRTLPLVETPGGYTVILFASGSDGIDSGSANAKTAWPGWAWCWRAWRGLGRNYRKNLKKLYIVHPTLFTKTLVRLIGTGSYFVSPKFAKKILQCDSLGDLGRHISLGQIEIMPEVLIHDLRVSRSSSGGSSDGEGKTLAADDSDGQASKHDEDEGSLPKVVRDCVEALRGTWGEGEAATALLDLEGLFRASPSNALLRAAKYAYSLNSCPNFARFVEKDPHLPAALLKDYLRRLDPPLFPAFTYRTIEKCPLLAGESNDDEATIEHLREEVLVMLTPWRLLLLTYVLELAAEASQHADRSRMDASNLATVLAPNLVCGPDPLRDVSLCRVQRSSEALRPGKTTLGTLLKFAIEHFYEIFDEAEYELPVLHLTERDPSPKDEDKSWNATLTRRARPPPSSSSLLGQSPPASSSAFSTTALDRSLSQLGIGEPPRRDRNDSDDEEEEEGRGEDVPQTPTGASSPRSRYTFSPSTSMVSSPPTSPLRRGGGGGGGGTTASTMSIRSKSSTYGRSTSSSVINQQKSRLLSPASQTMASLYSPGPATATNRSSSMRGGGQASSSPSTAAPAISAPASASASGGSGVALAGANATATFSTIRTPSSSGASSPDTRVGPASQVASPEADKETRAGEGQRKSEERGAQSSTPSSPLADAARAVKSKGGSKGGGNSSSSSMLGVVAAAGDKGRRPLSEVFEEQ